MGVATYQCQAILGPNFYRLDPVLPEEVNLDDAGCVDKLIGWASKENLASTVEWIRGTFIRTAVVTASSSGGGRPGAHALDIDSTILAVGGPAITDAEVGFATNVGAPLAWYDANNGEIGDICNAQQARVSGSNGQSWTVQKQWSN